MLLYLFTGSIARSTRRRYLVYSEADFEVFRPAGAIRCTDLGETWHGGGDRGSAHSTRVYGPLTRMSNTGVILDTRARGPSSRAPIHAIREHDSS